MKRALITILFVFYLGVAVGNYCRVFDKIYGGYLTPDGWFIVKFKSSIFPFFVHYSTSRIDDKFILDKKFLKYIYRK